MQRRVKTWFPPLRIVKPVLPFQLAGYLLAPVEVIAHVYTPAVPVHPDRHDMQVVAVDVLVLENKVRLVAEPHLFQILAGDVLQFRVGQHILGMRIQRDMHHRLFHFHLRRQEGEKALHRLVDVHRPRAVIEDTVGGKQPAFRFVNLLPVVGECAVQRVPYTDFCDHFASI